MKTGPFVSSLILWCGCLAIAAVPAGARAALLSGPITNPANGHAYYLLDSASWTASETEAVSLGGHLATIDDAAENDWVYDTFVPLLPTGGDGTLWIGLNDAAEEDVFVWASGAPVNFTNWSTGQPDNSGGTEDYAHVWTPLNMAQDPSQWRRWNDANEQGVGVGTPYGVVEVVPEPASVVQWSICILCVIVGYRWRRT